MINAVLAESNRLIVPVSDPDDALMHEMMEEMAQNNKDQQDWMIDADYGVVCIFRNETRWPGKIIEYVKGSKGDSISSLYEASPALATARDLGRVRKDLILEIAAKMQALPSRIGINDAGRERAVPLREMGTAQLIDMLAKLTTGGLQSILR